MAMGSFKGSSKGSYKGSLPREVLRMLGVSKSKVFRFWGVFGGFEFEFSAWSCVRVLPHVPATLNPDYKPVTPRVQVKK